MKAQAFLNLVGKMVTTQQDYFTAKKKGRIDAYNLLVQSKELEKQVMAVVKEGKLEPDEPLDTLNVQRHPVAPEQANLFHTENDNGKTS